MQREPTEHLLLKKSLLVQMLDEMCAQLDLTPTEYELARQRYEAVGSWLSESSLAILQDAVIYPHGSIALGTAVRPIGSAEFDVDLVAFLSRALAPCSPTQLKNAIGDRLKEHGTHAKMLEEKRRCWRINYAGEFHLDITPAVRNPACRRGGELVPDRELRRMKPTNPRGYIERFKRYAMLQPRLVVVKSFTEARADIKPLPPMVTSKSMLKRVVQLLKRHRDVYFLGRGQTELAPISIIITTLAAWSYAHCANRGTYEDEFEFLLDVVRRMPEFIQTQVVEGRVQYLIPNESTEGENFAERWNLDERLATAFATWHRAACEYITDLLRLEGIDTVVKSLRESFDLNAMQTACLSKRISDPISAARTNRTAVVSVAGGVASSALPSQKSVPVHSNTFYGE